MIKISNLSKEFDAPGGKIVALDNINLEINKGEIFGIIGPSGAGKSTLIRTINLLEKPTSGKIIINSQDLTDLNPDELRRKRQKIGMIFQHFNLLYSRTVKDNVKFPLEISGDKNQVNERIERLIDLVGLSSRSKAYPSQLSGGQKQRVGIARALANNPGVLLSDEATSSLDPESTENILELLLKIREEMGLTIILITHEMEVIKHICDRVAVIEGGKIIEQGTVLDIFSNPQQPLTKRFIRSVVSSELPPKVLEYISHEKRQKEKTIRVSFVGESTHKPLISTLIKKYEIDANILYGNIDEIQKVPFGTLVLQLIGDYDKTRQGINFLKDQGLIVEVLDDVRYDINVS